MDMTQVMHGGVACQISRRHARIFSARFPGTPSRHGLIAPSYLNHLETSIFAYASSASLFVIMGVAAGFEVCVQPVKNSGSIAIQAAGFVAGLTAQDIAKVLSEQPHAVVQACVYTRQ